MTKTIQVLAIIAFVIYGLKSGFEIDTLLATREYMHVMSSPIEPDNTTTSLSEKYPFFIEADNRAPRGTDAWFEIATGDSVIIGVNR